MMLLYEVKNGVKAASQYTEIWFHSGTFEYAPALPGPGMRVCRLRVYVYMIYLSLDDPPSESLSAGIAISRWEEER